MSDLLNSEDTSSVESVDSLASNSESVDSEVESENERPEKELQKEKNENTGNNSFKGKKQGINRANKLNQPVSTSLSKKSSNESSISVCSSTSSDVSLNSKKKGNETLKSVDKNNVLLPSNESYSRSSGLEELTKTDEEKESTNSNGASLLEKSQGISKETELLSVCSLEFQPTSKKSGEKDDSQKYSSDSFNESMQSGDDVLVSLRSLKPKPKEKINENKLGEESSYSKHASDSTEENDNSSLYSSYSSKKDNIRSLHSLSKNPKNKAHKEQNILDASYSYCASSSTSSQAKNNQSPYASPDYRNNILVNHETYNKDETVKIIEEGNIIDLENRENEDSDLLLFSNSLDMLTSESECTNTEEIVKRHALAERIMDAKSVRSRISDDDGFESDSIQKMIIPPEENKVPYYELEYKDINDENAKAILIRYRVVLQKFDDQIKKNRSTIRGLKKTIRTNKERNKMQEFTEEHASLIETVESNKNELDLGKEELRELKEEMISKDEEIKRLKNEIKLLEKTTYGKKPIEAALPKIQNLNNILANNIEKLTQKIEREKKRDQIAINKYNELNESVTKLENSEAEGIAAMNKYSIILERIDILRGKNRKMKNDNKVLLTKLAEFPVTNGTPKHIVDSKEKIKKCESMLDDYNKKISEQEIEIKILEKEIKQVRKKIVRLPKCFIEIGPCSGEMDTPTEEKEPLYRPKPLYKPNEAKSDVKNASVHSMRDDNNLFL